MTAPPLALNLLGLPTLVSGSAPVVLSPSATMLCAYLALAPREGRSRTVAATHLFADCSEPTARRRFNTALWRLRTEVRSSVGVELVDATGGRSLCLNDAVEMTVDATRFEELVLPVLSVAPTELTDDDASRLENAVALHRGRLVEPCHDDWVMADRYRIENLYLTALDYLVQHYGAHGEVGAVARYGELALDLEPLREDIHRHLMTAYGAAGRADLAERQFERCRMVLLQELGADPMPETIALYSRLAHGGGARSAGVDPLVAELERARREVVRLGAIVDRALERLHQMT
ncbi:MAG: AfsR/SARP family transcriptional regulator [Nocardioides sp.]